MARRSPLTDLAGLGLLAWAVLLAYISIPTLFSADPSGDGRISLLAALLATAHVAAALGVTRRAAWGRSLGLALGAIGLLGSGVVLLTLAATLLSRGLANVGGSGPALGGAGRDGRRLRADRRRSCAGWKRVPPGMSLARSRSWMTL